MTQHHDHDEHDHVHMPAWKGGMRYFIVAAALTCFAFIEGYLGTSVLHSPLVVADAGHNLSDVVFALAGGAVAILAVAARQNHFVSVHMDHYMGIVISLATIVVIAYAVIREAFEEQATGLSAVLMTALLGMASYAVNRIIARYLSHSDKPAAITTAAHFETDANVSLILVPTGLLVGLAGLSGQSWLPLAVLLLGATAVLGYTVKHNLTNAADIARELADCRRSDRLNGRKERE